VSTSPLLGPASALYYHPFTVGMCAADIKNAQLVLYYCADDGLGDPSGGGPNAMGVYLNGIPVPGTAGDISTWPGTNVKTIVVGNVAPYLLSGQNALELYVRDRNNGISGVLYSARIVISPCDWHFYGDPCGQTVPNVWLERLPAAGASVEYRIGGESLPTPQYTAYFTIFGVSDRVGPGGVELPLDLSAVGANGCQLLTMNDLEFLSISDPLGNAAISIPVPDLPVFYNLPIFAQTFAYDGVSNPLGLSATRGIAVDIRRP
jgi:hypothetical protein